MNNYLNTHNTKPERNEFAKKHLKILTSEPIMYWRKWRYDQQLRDLIRVARKELGYSDGTSDQDIFLTLRSAAISFKKEPILLNN